MQLLYEFPNVLAMQVTRMKSNRREQLRFIVSLFLYLLFELAVGQVCVIARKRSMLPNFLPYLLEVIHLFAIAGWLGALARDPMVLEPGRSYVFHPRLHGHT